MEHYPKRSHHRHRRQQMLWLKKLNLNQTIHLRW
jgi:hypothetical protein